MPKAETTPITARRTKRNQPVYPENLFPPGQHPAKQPRAARKAVASNVVPLRAKPPSTDDIVNSVKSRRLQQEQEILQMLGDANVALRKRHLDTMSGLLPIGHAMDYQTLLDWLEVGRRMLGRGGAA